MSRVWLWACQGLSVNMRVGGSSFREGLLPLHLVQGMVLVGQAMWCLGHARQMME